MAEKLLVFCTSSSQISTALLDKLIEELKERTDIEIHGVVDATMASSKSALSQFFKTSLFLISKKIFNWGETFFSVWLVHSNSFYWLCRKNRIKVFTPENFNINGKSFIGFVDSLADSEKKPIGLVIGCRQIFKKELLSKFDHVVNYHNSILPKYRGLDSTCWSAYFGETYTGFTFHLMEEGIDQGNILLQGKMPLQYEKKMVDNELEKLDAAGSKLGKLLDLMVARFKGRPQGEGASYFGAKEKIKMTTLENPEHYEFKEIERRLHCFGLLKINTGKEILSITAVRRVPSGSATAFKSADGVFFVPKRVHHWPVFFYFFKRRVLFLRS